MTEQLLTELQKPLDPKHVATRQGASNRKLSYLESWHVINEANRILGFDSWSMQTLSNDIVQCEKTQGENGEFWLVSYVAKVQVDALGVIRQGTGFGQGKDRDLGKAHESAIKESESDAMKRAFRSFGYQFGLALYDKTQSNVRTVDSVQDARKLLQQQVKKAWSEIGGTTEQFVQLRDACKKKQPSIDVLAVVTEAIKDGCDTIEAMFHYVVDVVKINAPFTL